MERVPDANFTLIFQNTRHWTKEEDKSLLRHALNKGTKCWGELDASGTIPRRDNKACCNRFLFLKKRFLEQRRTVVAQVTSRGGPPSIVCSRQGVIPLGDLTLEECDRLFLGPVHTSTGGNKEALSCGPGLKRGSDGEVFQEVSSPSTASEPVGCSERQWSSRAQSKRPHAGAKQNRMQGASRCLPENLVKSETGAPVVLHGVPGSGPAAGALGELLPSTWHQQPAGVLQDMSPIRNSNCPASYAESWPRDASSLLPYPRIALPRQQDATMWPTSGNSTSVSPNHPESTTKRSCLSGVATSFPTAPAAGLLSASGMTNTFYGGLTLRNSLNNMEHQMPVLSQRLPTGTSSSLSLPEHDVGTVLDPQTTTGRPDSQPQLRLCRIGQSPRQVGQSQGSQGRGQGFEVQGWRQQGAGKGHSGSEVTGLHSTGVFPRIGSMSTVDAADPCSTLQGSSWGIRTVERAQACAPAVKEEALDPWPSQGAPSLPIGHCNFDNILMKGIQWTPSTQGLHGCSWVGAGVPGRWLYTNSHSGAQSPLVPPIPAPHVGLPDSCMHGAWVGHPGHEKTGGAPTAEGKSATPTASRPEVQEAQGTHSGAAGRSTGPVQGSGGAAKHGKLPLALQIKLGLGQDSDCNSGNVVTNQHHAIAAGVQHPTNSQVYTPELNPAEIQRLSAASGTDACTRPSDADRSCQGTMHALEPQTVKVGLASQSDGGLPQLTWRDLDEALDDWDTLSDFAKQQGGF